MKSYLSPNGRQVPEAELRSSRTGAVDALRKLTAKRNSSSPQSLKSIVQRVRWETERNAIAAALEKTGWNRKAASRLLDVSYRTILCKIEQYEMSAPESHLLSGAGLTFRVRTKGRGSKLNREIIRMGEERKGVAMSNDWKFVQKRRGCRRDMLSFVAGALGASCARSEAPRRFHRNAATHNTDRRQGAR